MKVALECTHSLSYISLLSLYYGSLFHFFHRLGAKVEVFKIYFYVAGFGLITLSSLFRSLRILNSAGLIDSAIVW